MSNCRKAAPFMISRGGEINASGASPCQRVAESSQISPGSKQAPTKSQSHTLNVIQYPPPPDPPLDLSASLSEVAAAPLKTISIFIKKWMYPPTNWSSTIPATVRVPALKMMCDAPKPALVKALSFMWQFLGTATSPTRAYFIPPGILTDTWLTPVPSIVALRRCCLYPQSTEVSLKGYSTTDFSSQRIFAFCKVFSNDHESIQATERLFFLWQMHTCSFQTPPFQVTEWLLQCGVLRSCRFASR